MWKRAKFTADGNINHQVVIRKIILEHSEATTAVIYNEATNDHTAGKLECTVRNTTGNLVGEIDFGESGTLFNEGCGVDYNAGTVIVMYKEY
ncbi:MAG: hypothetical protein ACOWWR_18490 [Eubacteriales bacterium]